MDRNAFNAFYRDYYALILRFAERRITSDLALDVTAETFAIAWRKFDPAEPPSLPWLYQTARNVLGDLYRKRARDARLLQKLTNEARTAAPNGKGDDLLDLLSRLNVADRDVLMLTYWEGLNAAEVAEVLSCSEQAAWKRISRAKQKLRVLLEHESQEVRTEDAHA
ncbi:MAG: RNA polymerase sigma factor [Microbacteriaceae bacterium]